jgi:large subunit ribosomal protein L24
MSTHIKKGDHVKVIAGNHRGKEGKIIDVSSHKHVVVVEGVHMIKKHAKRSQALPQGGIIEREGPIHISNVKVIEHAAN